LWDLLQNIQQLTKLSTATYVHTHTHTHYKWQQRCVHDAIGVMNGR